jgi:RHS repeat-associated protein
LCHNTRHLRDGHISQLAITYDLNGNMINRASSSQDVYWSSYNYPITISTSDATGSEEVQFTYGPDRQRVEQIYTGPSGTEQTYYIGGLIDLVFSSTTNYRQYIYAGSEPIAVYSRVNGGANTMSYLLEDHQGSVSSIMSSAGIADINESFSAFGTRRNPITWSGAPVASDLTTIASLSRQGYTFQTWLGQSMGLNHMNGRVQDAILGRFLSPDPRIPDGTNAQSYNRYAYVNNNPLTLIDPTGFDGGCYEPAAAQNLGCYSLDQVTVQCTICCGGDSSCWSVSPPSPDLSAPIFNPPGLAPLNLSFGLPGSSSAKGAQSQNDWTNCLNGAVNAAPSSSSPPTQASEAADNFADSASAADTLVGALAASSPAVLGRAIGPLSVPGPGFSVTPTSAMVGQYGQSFSELLETSAPYLTALGVGTAVLGGAVSAYQGGQIGGGPAAISAASTSALNFYADTAIISSTGPVGIPVAYLYNKSGASNQITRTFVAYGNIWACNAVAGAVMIDPTP